MIKLTDEQIESAAKKMAECFDFSWDHMPEQGRKSLRSHAQTVIAAADISAIEAEVLRINGWQPIETGPRDRTPVLAIVAGNQPHTSTPYTPSVVEIDGDHVHLHCDSEEDSWTPLKEWKLSHWMPLPAAPGDHIGDANKMVERRQLIEIEQRARLRERFKDRVPSPATADFDLPVACSDDATPRATGCPDTMDDMGRFAVDQKAADEEKSPPATGPAG